MRYKTVKFSNLEIDGLLQEVKDGDFDVTVTEDNIDSGEATAGQVLTANGDGGAQFADPVTYESKPAASGGTDVSLVSTGEKYTWNNKQDAIVPYGQGAPAIAEVVGVDGDGHITTNDITNSVINSGSATSVQVLTADGKGGASWANAGGGSGMTNPMTTAGDIIVGGASGTPTRLGLGTAGQVLKVNAAGTGLEYGAGGNTDTSVAFREYNLDSYGYYSNNNTLVVSIESGTTTDDITLFAFGENDDGIYGWHRCSDSYDGKGLITITKAVCFIITSLTSMEGFMNYTIINPSNLDFADGTQVTSPQTSASYFLNKLIFVKGNVTIKIHNEQ